MNKFCKNLIQLACIVIIGLLIIFACKFFTKVNKSTSQNTKNILSTLVNKIATSDLENMSGPYNVERVIDGDTIVVTINNESVKIRTLGVNTPESVSNDDNENCKEGEIASEFTHEQLDGQKVWLEYDVEKFDKYDRTLAYVYLEDGSMFNETLLENGYARTMSIEPNVKYASRFKSIEDNAKSTNSGFWLYNQWQAVS